MVGGPDDGAYVSALPMMPGVYMHPANMYYGGVGSYAAAHEEEEPRAEPVGFFSGPEAGESELYGYGDIFSGAHDLM